MSILAQSFTVDWQVIAVFTTLVAALAYLLLRRLKKKTKACGSSCSCTPPTKKSYTNE